MEAARQIYPEIAIGLPRPRIKPVRSQARAFEFNKFMYVLVFFGAMAFVHVYQQALVAQNGIEIARVKAEIKEGARTTRALKIQKMLLKSPSRIERIATVKLGMVKPAGVTYIVMPRVPAAKPKLTHKRPVKGVGAALARVGFPVR